MHGVPQIWKFCTAFFYVCALRFCAVVNTSMRFYHVILLMLALATICIVLGIHKGTLLI